jgi:hypothetical protein
MAGQNLEFLANLSKYGVAKTSHFRVSIPSMLAGSTFSELDRIMGLRCETSELPGRQLVSNDSRTYGPTYKTPYQNVYQELTLNFIETGDFLIRGFFEDWTDQIISSKTNILSYPDQYRLTVLLTQYDVFSDENDLNNPLADLRRIASWTLFNTFPTAINQMPVSWAEDGLHRVTVTMAFEWYSLDLAGTGVDKSQVPTYKPDPKGSANK